MKTAPLLYPTQRRDEFTCPRCGHKATVVFHDPSAFDEPEPIGGRDRWAQEQALADAQAKLEKRTKAALALVRCPACGQRDAAAVRRALRPAVLPVVALAPALFMAGVMTTALLFPSVARAMAWLPVLVGSLVLIGAAPLILLRRHRQILDEADHATRFLS